MLRFTSYFSTFSQNRTTNFSNKSLAIINGAFNQSGIPMSNLLVNGNANLGAQAKETIFSKIFVVNGNLNSQHTTFETLEVNGNSKLDSCTISDKGEFLGNAEFTGCTVSTLDLRGKDFTLQNSTVTGDIVVSSIMGKGKLILDNTTVRGSAKFIIGDGEIILINGASTGNS